MSLSDTLQEEAEAEARWEAAQALQPHEGYGHGEDDYDDEPGEHRCMTCGGDGFLMECDGDCPESDDCGCPYGGRHTPRCPNCGGSGLAKDQRYW